MLFVTEKITRKLRLVPIKNNIFGISSLIHYRNHWARRDLTTKQDDSSTSLVAAIPQHIKSLMGRDLIIKDNHPLMIIKWLIADYFEKSYQSGKYPKFELIDQIPPIVTVKQCFDELLTPKDHVSRSLKDNYYVDETRLLRPHTSAHQTEFLRKGKMAFLFAGDVYRRDSIDASHYPVFHQMEGVRLFPDTYITASTANSNLAKAAEENLKQTLEGLVKHLFGQETQTRWVDAYFPFTDPSFELEIFFNEKWLEVLGCGVVQKEILRSCNLGNKEGWAFGLGLERLAMVLLDIPDIRLFWSEDPRFLSQFENAIQNYKRGKPLPKFKPFSKYPLTYKDVAFWLPPGTQVHENDFCNIVRGVAGDLVEEVIVKDKFIKPASKGQPSRESNCYRINFRSMERTLKNEEVNQLLNDITREIVKEFKVEMR